MEIGDKSVIKIHVPRANYKDRPIFVGENPYQGTYKRQNDGDFKCCQDEVNTLIRDASEEGSDSRIIEHYDMDDIDLETLRKYRNHFEVRNSKHAFIDLNDQEFLLKLRGIGRDRVTKKYYLTQAGLLLFGKGLSIQEVFPGLNFDYLDKRDLIGDQRWSDRLTIDFTWENNLYNFYTRVLRKIVDDLKRSFRLDTKTLARIDDTPIHAAVREAFANAVIHSDYNISGTLKVERHKIHFMFSNPGILKLPLEEIFQGGRSVARNPIIQKCFRMIGYGESIGSGFPTIIRAWREQHWRVPQLEENHHIRDVTLTLWMTSLISEECLEKLKLLFGRKMDSLNSTEILALSTAELEGVINNVKLQSITDVHGYDLGKMLMNLVRRGFLAEKGYGRGKVYFLNEEGFNEKRSNQKVQIKSSNGKGSNQKVQIKGSNNLDEMEQREIEILEVLKKNPQTSRAMIVETLGLSQKKVQSALISLTEQNRIRRIGSTRGYWEIIE